MASQGPPLTLTLPSELSLLPLVTGFVEAVCSAHALDRPTTDAVVLATQEAVGNVMRHAHQGRPEAPLQVECRLGSGGIEVSILDDGEPFDLAAVPHWNPSEVRLGGRGVFIMRALMDELACRPRGQRGNALRMVKRFYPGAAASALSATT